MRGRNNIGNPEELARLYDAAFQYERTNGCCAQCVLAAVQDVLGRGTDDIFQASHTLSAGGGLTTMGTCGALAGALLAVGSVYGRTREDFASGPGQASFVVAKEVFDGFVGEFGGATCAEVQTKVMGRSFNMWDSNDFQAFLKAGGHEDKCPHVVGFAARLAGEYLCGRESLS
ncbi:MAG: C-GCAxxG-C-C family protein [Actinobacteria bacterium]|nr:C-GCAxxG-C-C family protein [Actinomycetota bacterium]